MSKKSYQETLDRAMEAEAELLHIENQIEELETSYLEKSWPLGNILIGWSEAAINNQNQNANIRIRLTPKDRIFSLSSATSKAFKSLAEIEDSYIPASI